MNGMAVKSPRLHSDRLRSSAWKQGMTEQSSASVVLPVMASGHHLVSIVFSNARARSAVRGTQLELEAVALRCLYKAEAPGEAGMTLSFFFLSLLRPLVSSHELGKGHTTKKQRQCIRNS